MGGMREHLTKEMFCRIQIESFNQEIAVLIGPVRLPKEL